MLAVAELVHRASRYADLRRDVASAHFTSLLNLFLASFAPDGAKSSAGDGPSNAAAAAPVSDPDDQAVVLRALEQLLQAMPASFKAHLPQLDGLCSSMLRAAGSASLREAAASLLSQLCRSAPSPGEFWAKLLDRTLNSLELLHDEVLAAYLPNADRIVQGNASPVGLGLFYIFRFVILGKSTDLPFRQGTRARQAARGIVWAGARSAAS